MTLWQISFGQLFEMLRPAAYALAALASACVLADALRRRLRPVVAAAWTLAAFAFPAVALPLYLLARLFSRRAPASTSTTSATATTDATGVMDATGVTNATGSTQDAPPPSRRRVFAVASAYALIVLALCAIYFVRDHRSADAHLARAADARLHNRRERAIDEYRAALRLEDDPHTRKLLGLELATAARHEEALAELRAALRAGEPDDLLNYRVALSLDSLGRRAEADAAYAAFLDTNFCRRPPPLDARCAHAATRTRRP